MGRRRFVLALGGAVLAAAGARRAAAQPRRVGVLAPSTRAKEEVTLRPFFEAMRELGWVEPQTVVYERFFADDLHDRLPALAADLVSRGPEVIYAPPSPAAVAAARATSAIPVVFASLNDPVGLGIVKSLAEPGGNVTGVATIGADLGPKRLELLKELLPAVRRVGIIGVKSDANSLREIRDVELAAQGLGFRIDPATLSDIGGAALAIDALLRADAEVILLTQAPLLFNARKRLLAQAAKVARPVIAHRSEFAEDGALASYGPSLAAQLRRSATFVDRVLKGARPAELPVERPTTFELVVNRVVARAFRVAVPNSVLLRADRVID